MIKTVLYETYHLVKNLFVCFRTKIQDHYVVKDFDKNYPNWKQLVGNNAQFRDMYKGKRCFILGNGPSIKDVDFASLQDEFVFTKNALKFYNDTPKSLIEKVEECDLLWFVDKGIDVKMVEVDCCNVSVDTPKDLKLVIRLIQERSLTIK